MWNYQFGVLLACLMLGIGCDSNKTVPTPSVGSVNTVSSTDQNIPTAEPQGISKEPQIISTVPVISTELKGVWYGVARDTGVVIQFIGRQSREPDQRSVVSGTWVVHVNRSAIGSMIEFTDNTASGAVDLTVGLVNVATNKAFTSNLGRVERGGNGILYLSIYKNSANDLYVPANRIPLQRVGDQDKIQRAAIDQMRDALKNKGVRTL